MATVRLSTKAVGSAVKLKIKGVAKEFIIVHQGKPSSLYDDSCNGTWVLMKDLYEKRQWHSADVNKLESSTIHTYLNGDFLKLFDADIKAAIKQVKIPYRSNGGSGGTNQSGANGLSTKIFLLSGYEVGLTTNDDQNYPVDGARLSYFGSGEGTAACNRRIAYLNGTVFGWWLRSPYSALTNHTWYINTSGSGNYSALCSTTSGIRPALVLPPTLWVDDDSTVTTNASPTISGSNQNLGNKNTNFNIGYSVNDVDSADVLTITEKRDNTTIRTINNATRNLTYTIPITITGVTLGAHTVTITVTDGKGGTATRTYTFTRVNAAPTISGSDQNLGDKNAGFTITYQVNDSDGDALTVTEQLNSTTLRTLNNPQKGSNITLTLTDEQIRALTVNTSNTIKITANDGNGGVAYRTHTFTRTNTAPTISGEDEDMGTISDPFSRTYIISDAEGDEVEVRELLGDTVLRTYTATAGEENTIEVPVETWQQHPPGASALKVEATDSQGATSVRLYQFVKVVNQFCFCRKIPFTTDAAVKRAILTPTWNIIGSTEKVEVCNNAFDEVPTWEDMTTQVRLQRPFNLSNETKTAEQWGLNYRVTATKNEGYIGEISCTGIGGAFD